MLTIKFWYFGVINYELVVSFDVAVISTLVVVKSTDNVRLEDELQISDTDFMEIVLRPRHTLDLHLRFFLLLFCKVLEGIRDLDYEELEQKW